MESYELFFLGFQDSEDPLLQSVKALELSKLFYEKPATEVQEAVLYLIKALLHTMEAKDQQDQEAIFKKLTQVY